jgi:hypothetical protein
MNKPYSPTHPLARVVFVVVALVATVSTGAFIDGLAQRYRLDGQQAVRPAPAVVAAVQR